jgi:hypothetical protein
MNKKRIAKELRVIADALSSKLNVACNFGCDEPDGQWWVVYGTADPEPIYNEGGPEGKSWTNLGTNTNLSDHPEMPYGCNPENKAEALRIIRDYASKHDWNLKNIDFKVIT